MREVLGFREECETLEGSGRNARSFRVSGGMREGGGGDMVADSALVRLGPRRHPRVRGPWCGAWGLALTVLYVPYSLDEPKPGLAYALH